MIVRNGLVWEVWSTGDGARRYLGFNWSLRRARRRLERADVPSDAPFEDLDGTRTLVLGGDEGKADVALARRA